MYFAMTQVSSRAGCWLWVPLGDHLVGQVEREEMVALLRGLR